MGVIKKLSEPTNWVSSIAISQKLNGRLRICLEKDLNRENLVPEQSALLMTSKYMDPQKKSVMTIFIIL